MKVTFIPMLFSPYILALISHRNFNSYLYHFIYLALSYTEIADDNDRIAKDVSDRSEFRSDQISVASNHDPTHSGTLFTRSSPRRQDILALDLSRTMREIAVRLKTVSSRVGALEKQRQERKACQEMVSSEFNFEIYMIRINPSKVFKFIFQLSLVDCHFKLILILNSPYDSQLSFITGFHFNYRI